LNSDSISYGITRSDGTFTFSRSGTYIVGYSIQWHNTNTSIVETNVFTKKNNQIVPESSSYASVPNSHGGVPGEAITAVTYIQRFVANDTLQFWWHSNNADCTIHTIASQASNPEMPRSPGVIVTISQIS